MNDSALRVLTLLMGITHLVLGAFMAIAPGAFYDAVGPFGAQNDHYTRDVSTYDLALGVAFLIAARRPTWRVPVIAFTLLQYVLHTINHVIDIGDADPKVIGPADAVSLALGAVILAGMLRAALREGAATR
jgi:hypothetical protein